jgi:hypothetical protein
MRTSAALGSPANLAFHARRCAAGVADGGVPEQQTELHGAM